jgi:hypothetical protein
VLLDQARDKVVSTTDDFTTWEVLCHGRSASEVQEYITQHCELTSEIAWLVCGQSAVRQAGNIAAHNADIQDIRTAITQQPFGDRPQLEAVFKYVYGEEV